MEAQNDTKTILYQLTEPVIHDSSNATFDTGFCCIAKDMDFTIFFDVSPSFRDSVPIFNCAADTTEYNNNQIQGKIASNGTFSVGQYPNGGNIAPIILKGVSSGTIPGWGWTSTARVVMCLVHEKGSNSVRAIYKIGSNIQNPLDVIGNEWPTNPNYNLSSKFKGTLNALTVYSWAMTDTECLSLVTPL